jgi:hypothetical protein
LTYFLKRSLELKRFPSTSSLIPPLKKRMPRRNRGSTTNCATVSASRAQLAGHHRPLQCRTRTQHELGGIDRG